MEEYDRPSFAEWVLIVAAALLAIFLIVDTAKAEVPAPCVHYFGDGCKTPTVEPWLSHCPERPIGISDMKRSIPACSTQQGSGLPPCPPDPNHPSSVDHPVLRKSLQRHGVAYDVWVDGKIVARCQSGDCPYEVEKAAGDTHAYTVTIRLADGSEMKAVARSDKACPMNNCNGTLRVKVSGQYPVDDTYPARISERSTGQIKIDLVPIE